MKILFITSEVIPYAKTGGLADVSSAIPSSLSGLGHDVRVFMPKYGLIDTQKHGLKRTNISMELSLGPMGTTTTHIWEGRLPQTNVVVYLLENELYDRNGLYQENGKDYPDNAVRFTLLSKGAIALCEAISWKPDIFHCNDWQTGLVPIFLNENLGLPVFRGDRPATVLTIHNISYQGRFTLETLAITGLGAQYIDPRFDRLEFFGDLSFLKGGIVYSDVITTVSPNHAKEIQSAKFGFGLDGVIRKRKEKLVGILHGVDEKIWNPETDPHLIANYSSTDFSGKRECKRNLQGLCGFDSRLDIPVLGMVTRLVSDKGIDILIKALPKLMYLGVQLVLLGTGDLKYHRKLSELAGHTEHGGFFRTFLTFDEKLAHQIQAGSDIFLVPSAFEPGGLTQMISLRYGTIPIVRNTGGLADTINDYSFILQDGNGFVFDAYSSSALFRAIDRAVYLFKSDSEAWEQLMKKGMEIDFSWRVAAESWERVYKMAIDKKEDRSS